MISQRVGDRIIAGLACALLLIGAPAPVHAAGVAPREVGTYSAWQYNFYYDHFVSADSCEKRGYAMKYYDPDFVGKVLNWQCVRHEENTRWSMHVLWAT